MVMNVTKIPQKREKKKLAIEKNFGIEKNIIE